jgi:hypothetical protein
MALKSSFLVYLNRDETLGARRTTLMKVFPRKE